MSEDNGDPLTDAARQFTAGQNQFLKMWTDFAGKMASAGTSFSPESTPPDTARQMRATFFEAWSEYCKQYMQSPEFLESWKKTIDGAIDFRRQMNHALGKMHHEFQGTSRQDVDQLMMALTHVERRLVDNLERVTDRLDDMAGQIETVEKNVADIEKSSASASEHKTKKKKKAAKKKSSGNGN